MNDIAQTLFTVLIAAQFVAIVLHDWLNIPGWTHGRQVYAALGPMKMWVGTAINSLTAGLAAWLAIRYWHRPATNFALNYWIIYCGFIVLGAIQAWWLPYFNGMEDKTKALYAQMYAGTRQVLPPRGDNPRPNLLHLCLHALFLSTFVLSVALRLMSLWR